MEAKFIICFRISSEKREFLKKHRKFKEFSIDFYSYSKCRILNIKNTNMIICHAIRDLNEKYVYEEIFSKEIPF